MKPSCYATKIFGLILLLNGLCSCAASHRIETILESGAGEPLTGANKSRVVQQLKSRFSDGDYGEVAVSRAFEGIRVVTDMADTSAAALRELEVFFGSVNVGFYDAKSCSDPEVQQWIGELTPYISAFFPSEPTAAGRENVMFEVPYGLDHYAFRESLLLSLPLKNEYSLFWARPKVLEPNVKDPVRLLYLYRNDRKTGGPQIDNSSIKKAATIINDYGEPVISLEFTDEGREIFTRMTTEAFQDNNRTIGIVVNGEVWSNPSVQGPISGGRTWITGGLSGDPLRQISRQMAWEPLSVELRVKSQRVVPKK